MKRKILQCVRELRPGGGVSGVAYNLEQHFRLLNCETRRLTIEDLGRLSVKPHTTTQPLRKKLRTIFEGMWYSVAGTAIARKLRLHPDVVVITHNDVLFGDIYVNHGFHRGWLFDLPLPDRLLRLFFNPLHVFLLSREWLRFRLNVHRRIVCFCKTDAESLIRAYPTARDRIAYIPNGVDIARFKPDQPARESLRQHLGYIDGDFVLIFVGHEFVRKGLRFALDALSLLPSRVKLLVVGGAADVSYGKFVRKVSCSAYKDRVQFLGTRADIHSLLNAADALVLPSFSETWALVGLEAMACGIPVLMTAVGGITEYLHDGINGFIVERDAQDIAEKTCRLMDDAQRLEQLKKSARLTATQYSWSTVATAYLELIDGIQREKQREAVSRDFRN